MMLKKIIWVFGVMFALNQLSGEGVASQKKYGIENYKAPGWEVEQWINLPEGKSKIDVSDFEGKVVYLYCFQSWCPGCHSIGFPTMKKVYEEFKDTDDVAVVAVQTTFEGFSSNTFKHAKEIQKRYELEMPIGQSGSDGKTSPLMRKYRSGGTPWTVIIDKKGVVRFNDFHVNPDGAIAGINILREEGTKKSTTEHTDKH